MNSTVNTLLTDVGHFFKFLFGPKMIPIEASIAELAFPQFAVLIAAAAAAIINAENAAIISDGQKTGPVKSAMVMAQITSPYTDFCKSAGLPDVAENKQKFVNSMVDFCKTVGILPTEANNQKFLNSAQEILASFPVKK